jgi:hypothetical protein
MARSLPSYAPGPSCSRRPITAPTNTPWRDRRSPGRSGAGQSQEDRSRLWDGIIFFLQRQQPAQARVVAGRRGGRPLLGRCLSLRLYGAVYARFHLPPRRETSAAARGSNCLAADDAAGRIHPNNARWAFVGTAETDARHRLLSVPGTVKSPCQAMLRRSPAIAGPLRAGTQIRARHCYVTVPGTVNSRCRALLRSRSA